MKKFKLWWQQFYDKWGFFPISGGALGDGDTWDETSPSNSTNLSDGDDHIRDLRKGVRIRAEYEHSTFGSSNAGGKHKFVTLQNQASKPTVDATQVSAVYTKQVGGVQELFFEDEAGNEIQITSGAGLNVSAGGILGMAYNLAVAKASDSTVTVTADELVLMDASNNKTHIYSVSETIDIASTGASGRITALAEAANTIYYIWIARKGSDGTVNGFISDKTTKSDFLTQLGSGTADEQLYTQVALVSCVGNNNSSNFIGFTQTGREYFFSTWGLIASGNVGFGGWTEIDLTPANLSTYPAFVPSALSNYCFGTYHVPSSQSGVITNDNTITAGNADVPGKYCFGSVGAVYIAHWQFYVKTADKLWWGSTSASNTVYLAGFYINKLGV